MWTQVILTWHPALVAVPPTTSPSGCVVHTEVYTALPPTKLQSMSRELAPVACPRSVACTVCGIDSVHWSIKSHMTDQMSLPIDVMQQFNQSHGHMHMWLPTLSIQYTNVTGSEKNDHSRNFSAALESSCPTAFLSYVDTSMTAWSTVICRNARSMHRVITCWALDCT